MPRPFERGERPASRATHEPSDLGVRSGSYRRIEGEHSLTKKASKTAAGNVDITKGDFFEMLLVAFEGKAQNVDLAKLAETMGQAPVPPARDKAAGRDRAVELFVTGDLAKALNRRGSKHGWTISETVEHACAMAKRAEGLAAELEQPCGHCGKPRKR